MNVAALLSLLLLPGQVAPTAEEDAAPEQRFAAAAAHLRDAHADPRKTEAAIDAMTQYLADEARRGRADQYTALGYQIRGRLLLNEGRAEAALADFDQALAIRPDDFGVLFARADALDSLGRGDEAAAVRSAAEELMRRVGYGGDWLEALPGVYDSLESLLDVQDLRLRGAGPLLVLTAFVCGPLFLLNLWCAWTQWREGRGRRGRLLWVCAVFVLLEIAPLGVLIAWGLLSPERGTEWSFAVTLLLAWNVVALLTALGRPVRLAYRKGALPLVEDAPFLARISELSAKMGLPAPVVRLVTSLGGEQQALAFAGGLTAPSVVVTDGILHRLDADERDAVVAHELAHHANGSIWWLVAVTTVANSGAIAFDPLVPESVTFLLAFALRVGLYRFVSRYFERDCDRRAAAVLGFRNCCSALRKIHAVHPLRNEGWLSVLIYATATHPSVIERLHWLWEAAPADDKPDVEWSVADYRRRRMAAALAGVLWSGLVGASLWRSMVDGSSVWPSIVLAGLAVGVPLLPLLATLGQLRRNRRRAPTGQWKRLAPLAVGAAGVGVFYAGSEFLTFEDGVDDWFTWLMLLITVGGLGSALLLLVAGTPTYVPRLRNDLLSALHDHDFAKAAKLGLDNARRMMKVPDFRHNTAVAIALAGDYPRGLAELQSNFRDHPKFVQSLLTQSAFCCEEGDYAQALDLARQATERLPGDPEPLIKEAWALRRLGRAQEAEAAARRALEIDCGEAGPHLILAALAIDRGDEQTARAELALAERLSPGSPFGRLIEAEAAVRFDTPAAAAGAIERAAAAAKANPFAVIDRQIAVLRTRAGKV